MELLKTTIGDYVVDPRDEFVCKELKSTGDYQPSERALYFHLLKPTDNVLWLGAHDFRAAGWRASLHGRTFVSESDHLP